MSVVRRRSREQLKENGDKAETNLMDCRRILDGRGQRESAPGSSGQDASQIPQGRRGDDSCDDRKALRAASRTWTDRVPIGGVRVSEDLKLTVNALD